MAYLIAFLVIMLAIIAYAVNFGGPPERAGAGILAAMVAITYVAHLFFVPVVYRAVDPIGLTVDLIGLVGFSWLGISSRRVWPLWAGSFQLLSTGAHFVRALSIPVHPLVYYWMKTMPTVMVMLLLIIGTMAHALRSSRRKQRS